MLCERVRLGVCFKVVLIVRTPAQIGGIRTHLSSFRCLCVIQECHTLEKTRRSNTDRCDRRRLRDKSGTFSDIDMPSSRGLGAQTALRGSSSGEPQGNHYPYGCFACVALTYRNASRPCRSTPVSKRIMSLGCYKYGHGSLPFVDHTGIREQLVLIFLIPRYLFHPSLNI